MRFLSGVMAGILCVSALQTGFYMPADTGMKECTGEVKEESEHVDEEENVTMARSGPVEDVNDLRLVAKAVANDWMEMYPEDTYGHFYELKGKQIATVCGGGSWAINLYLANGRGGSNFGNWAYASASPDWNRGPFSVRMGIAGYDTYENQGNRCVSDLPVGTVLSSHIVPWYTNESGLGAYSASQGHAATIVYKDDEYIYIAGFGGNKPIRRIAEQGYEGKYSRTSTVEAVMKMGVAADAPADMQVTYSVLIPSGR